MIVKFKFKKLTNTTTYVRATVVRGVKSERYRIIWSIRYPAINQRKRKNDTERNSGKDVSVNLNGKLFQFVTTDYKRFVFSTNFNMHLNLKIVIKNSKDNNFIHVTSNTRQFQIIIHISTNLSQEYIIKLMLQKTRKKNVRKNEMGSYPSK